MSSTSATAWAQSQEVMPIPPSGSASQTNTHPPPTGTAGASYTDATSPPPPAPPAPREAREPDPGQSSGAASSAGGTVFKQRERGLVLYTHFTARLAQLSAVGNTVTNTAQSSLQGGLFAGYKFNRVLFGLHFDITSLETRLKLMSGDNSSNNTILNTLFLLAPGVQFAILRSADLRLELVGAAEFGLGSLVSSNVHDPELRPDMIPAIDSSTLYVAWRLAPGLRYWATQQLALSVLTGVGGDHLFNFQNNASGRSTLETGTTSFNIALGALGVF